MKLGSTKSHHFQKANAKQSDRVWSILGIKLVHLVIQGDELNSGYV